MKYKNDSTIVLLAPDKQIDEEPGRQDEQGVKISDNAG